MQLQLYSACCIVPAEQRQVDRAAVKVSLSMRQVSAMRYRVRTESGRPRAIKASFFVFCFFFSFP